MAKRKRLKGKCSTVIYGTIARETHGDFIIQVNKIVGVWGKDNDTIIEGMPALLCLIIALAKYINGIYQTEKLKKIFEYIQRDNERLRNLPEYGVLHKYMMQGRHFIILFTVYLVASTVIYLTLPTAIIIYNELHPVNGTVVKELMYQVDYNVDSDKYFYLITFHCYATTIAVIAIVGALDTMYITLTQHACALLAVTGFRLKTAHILDTNLLREGEKDCEESANMNFTAYEQEQIYEKLILCIKEHQNVLEYTQLFQSVFSVTLFIQLCINIICLSISGVLTLMKMENLQDFMRVFIWMAGQFLHLFWLCVPGQNLVNYGEKLHSDSLDCMWYALSKKSGVLYQFVMMNTLKPCKLVAFKVTPLNMETYLSVTKAAMSYFTFISSSR